MPFSRRKFLVQSGAAVALVLSGCRVPQKRVIPEAVISPPRVLSPNDKLNVAFIGAGGRGFENMEGFESENIVALCDVDFSHAAKAFEKYPGAARYQDFRLMLEKEPSIDAVVVSTPDHTHAVAAIWALGFGKHVYCEKPLARSIYEVRAMHSAAKKAGVATQFGIQGHAMEGAARLVQMIRMGIVGNVSVVHVWTDRPIWPQGIALPVQSAPAPLGLDWNLWLGPAAARPYHTAYHPFSWRGWWDFGTGALGDMGCHNMDIAFWALDLGVPQRVTARSSGPVTQSFPAWSIIEFFFPARGEKPPVKMIWYDGGAKPESSVIQGLAVPSNGCALVGDSGVVLIPDWHAQTSMILGGSETVAASAVEDLEESPGHYQEWIRACKGGPAARASFDYAAPLSELVLLGNLALQMGVPIEWDAPNMQVVGQPGAQQWIKPSFRKGWEIDRLL